MMHISGGTASCPGISADFAVLAVLGICQPVFNDQASITVKLPLRLGLPPFIDRARRGKLPRSGPNFNFELGG